MKSGIESSFPPKEILSNNCFPLCSHFATRKSRVYILPPFLPSTRHLSPWDFYLEVPYHQVRRRGTKQQYLTMQYIPGDRVSPSRASAFRVISTLYEDDDSLCRVTSKMNNTFIGCLENSQGFFLYVEKSGNSCRILLRLGIFLKNSLFDNFFLILQTGGTNC